MIVLGSTLIALTLAFPYGVTGTLLKLLRRWFK